MRFSLFVLQILLDYVILLSTGVATPAPGDANSPQSKAYLEERYVTAHDCLINETQLTLA